MEKFYVVVGSAATKHTSYEDAEKYAKKAVTNSDVDPYGRRKRSCDEYFVCEAVAQVSAPVPNAEVVKFS
jgi:hypothetical protein